MKFIPCFVTPKKSKVTGSDFIPSIIYREAAVALAKPLKFVFDNILKSRNYPLKWKYSHVRVLAKSTSCDINNLRPISLLPVPSLLFEKLILKRP